MPVKKRRPSEPIRTKKNLGPSGDALVRTRTGKMHRLDFNIAVSNLMGKGMSHEQAVKKVLKR